MAVDVCFLLFMLLAIFRGLKQGLIISVFSVLALILGLAIAIKGSAVVAGYGERQMSGSSHWWPVLAFILVFVVVVLLVRGGALLAEKLVDLVLMGWLNKLAGVLLYAAVYTTILSVLLFYAVQVHIVSAGTLSSSKTYPFIRPWGPLVINALGWLIPFFKDMFVRLSDFFHTGEVHLPSGK